eukprot:gene26758-4336_t
MDHMALHAAPQQLHATYPPWQPATAATVPHSTHVQSPTNSTAIPSWQSAMAATVPHSTHVQSPTNSTATGYSSVHFPSHASPPAVRGQGFHHLGGGQAPAGAYTGGLGLGSPSHPTAGVPAQLPGGMVMQVMTSPPPAVQQVQQPMLALPLVVPQMHSHPAQQQAEAYLPQGAQHPQAVPLQAVPFRSPTLRLGGWGEGTEHNASTAFPSASTSTPPPSTFADAASGQLPPASVQPPSTAAAVAGHSSEAAAQQLLPTTGRSSVAAAQQLLPTGTGQVDAGQRAAIAYMRPTEPLVGGEPWGAGGVPGQRGGALPPSDAHSSSTYPSASNQPPPTTSNLLQPNPTTSNQPDLSVVSALAPTVFRLGGQPSSTTSYHFQPPPATSNQNHPPELSFDLEDVHEFDRSPSFSISSPPHSLSIQTKVGARVGLSPDGGVLTPSSISTILQEAPRPSTSRGSSGGGSQPGKSPSDLLEVSGGGSEWDGARQLGSGHPGKGPLNLLEGSGGGSEWGVAHQLGSNRTMSGSGSFHTPPNMEDPPSPVWPNSGRGQAFKENVEGLLRRSESGGSGHIIFPHSHGNSSTSSVEDLLPNNPYGQGPPPEAPLNGHAARRAGGLRVDVGGGGDGYSSASSSPASSQGKAPLKPGILGGGSSPRSPGKPSPLGGGSDQGHIKSPSSSSVGVGRGKSQAGSPGKVVSFVELWVASSASSYSDDDDDVIGDSLELPDDSAPPPSFRPTPTPVAVNDVAIHMDLAAARLARTGLSSRPPLASLALVDLDSPTPMPARETGTEPMIPSPGSRGSMMGTSMFSPGGKVPTRESLSGLPPRPGTSAGAHNFSEFQSGGAPTQQGPDLFISQNSLRSSTGSVAGTSSVKNNSVGVTGAVKRAMKAIRSTSFGSDDDSEDSDGGATTYRFVGGFPGLKPVAGSAPVPRRNAESGSLVMNTSSDALSPAGHRVSGGNMKVHKSSSRSSIFKTSGAFDDDF